jgi:hypothetical protein
MLGGERQPRPFGLALEALGRGEQLSEEVGLEALAHLERRVEELEDRLMTLEADVDEAKG